MFVFKKRFRFYFFRWLVKYFLVQAENLQFFTKFYLTQLTWPWNYFKIEKVVGNSFYVQSIKITVDFNCPIKQFIFLGKEPFPSTCRDKNKTVVYHIDRLTLNNYWIKTIFLSETQKIDVSWTKTSVFNKSSLMYWLLRVNLQLKNKLRQKPNYFPSNKNARKLMPSSVNQMK